MANSNGRNFCFTLNNPSTEEKEAVLRCPLAKYVIFGEEKGEKDGTPHLQGYFEMKKTVRFSALKKLYPRMHIEKRGGSQRQAILYCMKGSQSHEEWQEKEDKGPNFGKGAKVSESGKCKKQGQRNDLEQVSNMIRSGKRPRDIAEECPTTYIKHHKGIHALVAALVQPRNEKPHVTVLWGKTGTGKSRKARELLKEDVYIWHPQQNQWFDGYYGQTRVIFEEFRGQIPYGMLLSILDRYDCTVQLKGAIVQFAAVEIVLTSPVPPTQWYTSEKLQREDSIDQLLRRIDVIEEMT